MIALLAAAMMTLAASSAMAAFQNGDLLRVVYNHAGTVEVTTDLGNINSLLSNPSSMSADTFSLSSITGATSASDLYVAYFASNYVGSSNVNQAYVGAAAGSTLTNPAARKYSGFNTGYSNMELGYRGLNATATTILFDQANVKSYANALTGSTGYGSLNGFLPMNAGEQNLADLIASGGQTTIYGWNNISPTSSAMTGAATSLVLTTNFVNGIGSTTPSAVPIPAAAYLLGSGLMGLIGIRRKSIKA